MDQHEMAERRADIADDVTAKTKELMAHRTGTLRTRAEQAEVRVANALLVIHEWQRDGESNDYLTRVHKALNPPVSGVATEHPGTAATPSEEQAAPVDWEAVTRRRERALKTVGEQKHAVEQERDGAYRERAHLVALLAAMTDNAVIAYATDVEEPGWQIVYLTIGGRQASWHISPSDADLFAHVERVEIEDPRAHWDGHTTEEKYLSIAAWTAELMERCGPECAEMHRGGFRCTAGRG